MPLSSTVRCSQRALAAAVACSVAYGLPLHGARARAQDDAPLLAQAPGATPAPAKPPAPPAAARPEPSAAEPEPSTPEPAEADVPEAQAAKPEATEAPPDEPEPELEPELAPSEVTLSPQEATNAGKQRLQKRLEELDAERASTTNALPWITVATGATVVVVSASVGAVNAFDCDRDTECTAPPWASLAVVIGAAIATAGAVWLVRTDAEIRELDLQRNLLKRDLERLEMSRAKREGLARRDAPQVSFRVAF